MNSLDELFSSQEERDDAKLERVKEIPLTELHPFKDHPFKIQNDDEMKRLMESIQKFGTLTPALARPLPEGGYELISGHRRLAACRVLGIETMPVIIREMSDDETVIAMVDANLQREHILPSEKAFAYKMKLEAIKHQGITSRQVGEKLLSVTQVSKESDDILSSNHGENLRKNLSRVEKKKKPANGKNRLQTEHSGGESGIRTHGSTTFRVKW